LLEDLIIKNDPIVWQDDEAANSLYDIIVKFNTPQCVGRFDRNTQGYFLKLEIIPYNTFHR